MKLKIITIIFALTTMLSSGIFANTTVAYARSANRLRQVYTIQNLRFNNRSGNTLRFFDHAGSTVIVQVPSNRMRSLEYTMRRSRNQRFNFTLRTTQAYNAHSRQYTGTYINHRLCSGSCRYPNSSNNTQNQNNNSRGAQSATRNNRTYTIENLTYQRRSGNYFYFRDTANNTVRAYASGSRFSALNTAVSQNRNARFNLNLRTTRAYNPRTRECIGTYINHRIVGSSNNQNNSNRQSGNNNNISYVNQITRKGVTYTISNLVYMGVSGSQMYFKSGGRNSHYLYLQVGGNRSRLQRELRQGSRVRSMTFRCTSVFQNRSPYRAYGTYINHRLR